MAAVYQQQQVQLQLLPTIVPKSVLLTYLLSLYVLCTTGSSCNYYFVMKDRGTIDVSDKDIDMDTLVTKVLFRLIR